MPIIATYIVLGICFLLQLQVAILLYLVGKIDKRPQPSFWTATSGGSSQFIEPVSDKEKFKNAKDIDDLLIK